MATPNPVGPLGVPGGVPFDDGTYSSIKKLQIRYGEGFVSIQTTYTILDGPDHESDEHGTKTGGRTEIVNLADGEYLISFSGYYTQGSNPVVHSLTFQTNKKTYGPYGVTNGIPFSTSTNGKIVGFYGVSGEYINSISAHSGSLP